MNKKIKINLDTELMGEVNTKSNLPLSLIIRKCLEEYSSNTNLRRKIAKSINNSNNT